MNFLKSTLVLLFVLFFSACSQGTQIEGVSGKVTLDGYEGRYVYLESTSTVKECIDSALVKGGEFSFVVKDSLPQVYHLYLTSSKDDKYPIVLPVVFEKGHVKVTLGEYVLTSGTPLNDSLQDFLLAVSELSDKVSKEENLDLIELQNEFSKLVEASIMHNIKNPVGLYIYRLYNGKLNEDQKARILGFADDSFKDTINKKD